MDPLQSVLLSAVAGFVANAIWSCLNAIMSRRVLSRVSDVKDYIKVELDSLRGWIGEEYYSRDTLDVTHHEFERRLEKLEKLQSHRHSV